jgi:uncharacterized phage protein gp47/JayE
MPFQRPTLEEIINRIKADLKIRLGIATTLLRNSFLNIISIVYSGSVHLLFDYLTYMKDQLFITTSDERYLEQHGLEYGISRIFGEKAEGQVLMTGNVGVVVSAGARLQSGTGEFYITDTAATMTGTQLLVDVTAEEIGTEYNQVAGVELSFVSPVPGVESEVVVAVTGITNGTNTETDESYRQRVLTRKRQPPHGGIAQDYINWCKEIAGVTRAWSFPELYGIGTIGVGFVFDGRESITPTPAEVALVRDYIIEHTDVITGKLVGAPVTAEPGLFILPLQPLAVNFLIKVDPFTALTVSSMQTQLADLMIDKGGPGQTITISQMYEAITAAIGEEKSFIITPTNDVPANPFQVHVLGDVVIEEF